MDCSDPPKFVIKGFIRVNDKWRDLSTEEQSLVKAWNGLVLAQKQVSSLNELKQDIDRLNSCSSKLTRWLPWAVEQRKNKGGVGDSSGAMDEDDSYNNDRIIQVHGEELSEDESCTKASTSSSRSKKAPPTQKAASKDAGKPKKRRSTPDSSENDSDDEKCAHVSKRKKESDAVGRKAPLGNNQSTGKRRHDGSRNRDHHSRHHRSKKS